MESYKYLPQLEKIPGKNKHYDFKKILDNSERLRKDGIAIEVGIATEIATTWVFDNYNVDDSIFDAFKEQFPRLSETKSLYEKALEASDSESAQSLTGLVSGIKGKLYEISLTDKLEVEYPGWKFNIAEKANQPDWDIHGTGPEGQEVFIQAKAWGENRAGELTDLMNENPGILFSTTSEIQEKILETSPELASQFSATYTSNMELTEHVDSNLDQLLANYGIDVPDNIESLLPFVGEIVLGVRVLYEMSRVKKDFKEIDLTDNRKIKALRAIMAISRFGVTAVLALGGATMGSIFPGVGTLFGGIGGSVAAIYVNAKIKPYLYDFTLFLLDLSQEDLFYFKNKGPIDDLGKRFLEFRKKL